MTVKVRTAAGLKTVAALKVRTGAGLKSIVTGKVRASDGLKTFFSSGGSGAFTVSALPLVAFGGASSGLAVTVMTEYVSVTVTGGTAPYSYAWDQVGATAETWTIESIGSANTRFACSGVADGDSYIATFKCTVTDANGSTVDSANVEANVINYGSWGGFAP